MKFEFNGQEFDTDKPICVLGVQHNKGCWIAKSASEMAETLKNLTYYGVKLKAKKLYVSEMRFCKFSSNNYEKNNAIEMFLITAKRDETAWIKKDDNKVIGHSPQECLKIYNDFLKTKESK